MAAAAATEEMTMMTTAVVVLRCFDGTTVAAAAEVVAARSGLVAEAVAGGAGGVGRVVVDVPGNVSGVDVAAVVAYMEARAAAADGDAFDGEFVGGLTHDARIDLIHAAHHLADKALFNLLA
uniref:SKP1 component POZ domain-containing protein n=1 Tax=Oryza punctata TaxID=4537 RepID=A0A0E0M5L1_ORYPU